MESITSDAVAFEIVTYWKNVTKDFQTYLQIQFHYNLDRTPAFEAVHIIQTTDGDIANQCLGQVGLRKWEYSRGDLRIVAVNHAWNEMYIADPPGDFFTIPTYVFYFDGSKILLSERLGPRLIHRLLGIVHTTGGQLVVDWDTINCSTVE